MNVDNPDTGVPVTNEEVAEEDHQPGEPVKTLDTTPLDETEAPAAPKLSPPTVVGPS